MPIQTAFAFHSRDPDGFIDDLRTFTYNGNPSTVEYVSDVPYFFNEFWTSKQRDAHSIHEVSYRACFKPQLPDFFIQRLTREHEAVYDPFMGRGTTVLQAIMSNRYAIGNDINPLSTLLCRPRTNPPTLQQVSERLATFHWGHHVSSDDGLLAFYHPETLSQILSLRQYLIQREIDGNIDNVDDWIRMVAINRLTGHSPGFFSVYSLPPNQAVSVEAQQKINEARKQIPPPRSVPHIILRKTRSLLRDGVPPLRRATFYTESATKVLGMEPQTVDLAVTSPPFLDIVQYASDNWLRCWFSGIEPKSVDIAMHRKTEDWRDFIRSVFIELERVVRPGGHVAFEVGEVRRGRVELDKLVLEAISDLKFCAVAVLVNVQEFTKTANCWGVTNNKGGTNTNRIVVARRKNG